MRFERNIRRITILATVVATAAFASREAVACRVGHFFAPVGHVYPSAQDVVSGRVALAEVVAIDPLVNGRRHVGFRLIEALHGEVTSDFSIDVDSWAEWTLNDSDFNGHHDASAGRTGEYINCRIHPGFNKGSRYLVFLDALYGPRGSERIIVDDDLWLLEVRRVIAASKG